MLSFHKYLTFELSRALFKRVVFHILLGETFIKLKSFSLKLLMYNMIFKVIEWVLSNNKKEKLK
jgi:hypothetical protein